MARQPLGKGLKHRGPLLGTGIRDRQLGYFLLTPEGYSARKWLVSILVTTVMTVVILRVSGVSPMEKTLVTTSPASNSTWRAPAPLCLGLQESDRRTMRTRKGHIGWFMVRTDCP